MNRYVRGPDIPRRRGRNSVRQTTVVVIALGALLAFGWFATDEIVAARQRAAAAAAALAAGNDEIYTGSILYMPDDGRLCRQMLFDNHSGQLRDNGVVDCAGAAYHGSDDSAKQWSADRVRVIATGFRKG
jgi:hypothetical protein